VAIFFAEMVEDWTLNYKPDLLTFVPYEWSFNIILRDFEMVWLGNQHNWIECTSNKQENGALNSRFLTNDMSSKFPLTNFQTTWFRIWTTSESVFHFHFVLKSQSLEQLPLLSL